MNAAEFIGSPNDLLIFATAGVHARFGDGRNSTETPQQMAGQILRESFQGNDDALMLAARCLGTRHG